MPYVKRPSSSAECDTKLSLRLPPLHMALPEIFSNANTPGCPTEQPCPSPALDKSNCSSLPSPSPPLGSSSFPLGLFAADDDDSDDCSSINQRLELDPASLDQLDIAPHGLSHLANLQPVPEIESEPQAAFPSPRSSVSSRGTTPLARRKQENQQRRATYWHLAPSGPVARGKSQSTSSAHPEAERRRRDERASHIVRMEKYLLRSGWRGSKPLSYHNQGTKGRVFPENEVLDGFWQLFTRVVAENVRLKEESRAKL